MLKGRLASAARMARTDKPAGPDQRTANPEYLLIRPMTPRNRNMVFIVVLAIVAVAMYIATIINVGSS